MDIMEPWVVLAVERIAKSLVQHHNFEMTRRRLFADAQTRVASECLSLCGPSRNGKTLLAEFIELALNPKCRDDWMVSRPVVRFTCRNRGHQGAFTSKSFYQDALREIGHPMYTSADTDLVRNHDFNRRMDRVSNTTVAKVLEDTLEFLDAKFLIIDETHHLKYMLGGEKSALQMMESIKTLAAHRKLVLIFVGAYPMLDILKLSTHMLGRNHTIDMPRYRLSEPADAEHFESLLAWYSEGIKFEKGVTSLRDWNWAIYRETFGVIGLLSSWLRSALAEMSARGDSALAWDHLDFTRDPHEDRANIMNEILVGEQYLGVTGESIHDLDDPDPVEPSLRGSKKRRTKPFQTNVKRRKAGERS